MISGQSQGFSAPAVRRSGCFFPHCSLPTIPRTPALILKIQPFHSGHPSVGKGNVLTGHFSTMPPPAERVHIFVHSPDRSCQLSKLAASRYGRRSAAVLRAGVLSAMESAIRSFESSVKNYRMLSFFTRRSKATVAALGSVSWSSQERQRSSRGRRRLSDIGKRNGRPPQWFFDRSRPTYPKTPVKGAEIASIDFSGSGHRSVCCPGRFCPECCQFFGQFSQRSVDPAKRARHTWRFGRLGFTVFWSWSCSSLHAGHCFHHRLHTVHHGDSSCWARQWHPGLLIQASESLHR